MNQHDKDFDLAIRLLHVHAAWAIKNAAALDFDKDPAMKDPLWPKSRDLLDYDKNSYSNEEPLNEEILELLSRHPYKAP